MKITENEIIAIAEKDGKQSMEKVHERLGQFRSRNWRILNCILYVKTNLECSLNEAGEIVLNFPAWIDKKDAFYEHQEEIMAEYLEAAKNDIVKVEETYYPDRTEQKIYIQKRKNLGLIDCLEEDSRQFMS